MKHRPASQAAEELLLGTDTDRAIARKLNRTCSSVQHQRLKLGVPAAVLAWKTRRERKGHTA